MNTTQYGEHVNRSTPPINQDPDEPTVAAPGYSSGLAVGVEEGKEGPKFHTFFPQPVMSDYSIYKDLVSVGPTNMEQLNKE